MSKDKVFRTKFNLFLDAGLAAAFLIALKPVMTGLPFHEWFGLGIGAALVVHALAHRQWIVGITRQLLRRLPVKTRIYYALDATLLVVFGAIIMTGVLMSTVVLPVFGVQGIASVSIAQVHKWASYLALMLLGTKLVLHRTWIKNAIRRHVAGATYGPALASSALVPVPARSANASRTISRRRFLLIGCSAVGVGLLAIINKTRQAQGDSATTSTEVLSGDDASTVVDAPVATPAAAVTVEDVEPTAMPTTAPATVAAPQRAATRCPRGMVNDPYPGRCRHYVDKNGNGICDLSETA